MARFDVYPNRSEKGYLLDVQSDLLGGLNTRVVVPLLPRENAPNPAHRLNPVFVLEECEVVMATQFLAAVPDGELRTPIGSLERAGDDIRAALDMLFLGI